MELSIVVIDKMNKLKWFAWILPSNIAQNIFCVNLIDSSACDNATRYMYLSFYLRWSDAFTGLQDDVTDWGMQFHIICKYDLFTKFYRFLTIKIYIFPHFDDK